MKDFTATSTIYTIMDIWEQETKVYYEASFYNVGTLLSYIKEYMRVEDDMILTDSEGNDVCALKDCETQLGMPWDTWLVKNCNLDQIQENLSRTHYQIIETNLLLEKK